EEIFLYEAQRLASAGGIVGIKHTGDGFCGQGFSKGGDEIGAAGFLEVKVIRSRRSPQAKCVDVLSAISDNRPIIRNPEKAGRLSSNGAQHAIAYDKRGVQIDVYAQVRTSHFPWVGAAQPIVGHLILPAVFYGLLKHAVFIAKTITARGKLHRGHGIQETGSQTAEPTVTETGVRLLLNKGEPIDVLLVDEIVQERIE